MLATRIGTWVGAARALLTVDNAGHAAWSMRAPSYRRWNVSPRPMCASVIA